MLFDLVNLYAYLSYPNQIRRYRKRTGRFPDIARPRTIQEKFLWRKIFDHNPVFTEISDKLRAKAFAARRCPVLNIPQVLWQGNSAADVPQRLLSGNHVLKANHGCDFNLFLPSHDSGKVSATTRRWLSRPYGQRQGEWAYRNIERKLFIEANVAGATGQTLNEYKIHTCGGKAIWVFFIVDRSRGEPLASLFLPDGRCVRDSGLQGFAVGQERPPANLAKAITCAERLGAGFDYLRCDIMESDGTLFFNELTVYPQSGSPWNRDPEILQSWSDSWDLTQSWFLTEPQDGWRGLYADALRAHLREPVD